MTVLCSSHGSSPWEQKALILALLSQSVKALVLFSSTMPELHAWLSDPSLEDIGSYVYFLCQLVKAIFAYFFIASVLHDWNIEH